MLRAYRSFLGSDEAVRTDFYRRTPESWRDLQNLYEGYIQFNPQSIEVRISYADFAFATGHPDIGNKQIGELKALTTDPLLKEVIKRSLDHRKKDLPPEMQNTELSKPSK
jgi:hypothetical protein